MTVPSTARRAGPFTGTGSLTSYPFLFKVFEKADLQTTVADEDGLESTLVLDSTVLVTLNVDQDSTPGGSVQYAVGGVATALPAGYSLAITGEGLEYEQTADLPQGGNFNPVVIENALDRQMMLLQQQRDVVTRALQLSVTTPDGVDATLPTPVANNFIGWDGAGEGLRNIDPTTLATIVAFAAWQSETFDGTGAQTQFTLNADPGSISNLRVSVGGIVQRPIIDFTLSGLVLTFVVAPYAGTDNILAQYGQALPEGTSTLETDLANPAAGKGGFLVAFAQDYANAKTREMMSKAREVAVNVDDFIGATDAAILNNAFSSGAKALRLTRSVTIATDVTLPSGVSLFCDPGVTVTSSGGNFILEGAPDGERQFVERLHWDADGTTKQVYGEGADNVATAYCRFTGSTNHGLLMSVGPRNYRSFFDEFDGNGKYGLYVAGDASNAPDNIMLMAPYAHDNTYSGLTVAGYGERTTPLQTANYATNIRVIAPRVHDNGTFDVVTPANNAFSGLDLSAIVGLVVEGMQADNNAEHGAALQEVQEFRVTGTAKGNIWGGVVCQSGYAPSVATQKGIIDVVSTSNQYGAWFKEVCKDIVVRGVIKGNTLHNVRFSDLGGSGLYSEDVVGFGCITTGATNSNGSLRCYFGRLNALGQPPQPNVMEGIDIITATSINTKGVNETYPELITLDNSVAVNVARTPLGECIDRRRIVLRAWSGGSVNILHNNGGGSAPFINNSGATVTLAAGKSRAYIGNGTQWVEEGV